MFYINEIESGPLCQPGCLNKIFYQPGNFIVGHHQRVAGNPGPPVQKGVMVENYGLRMFHIMGLGNPSRMCQLQSNQ